MTRINSAIPASELCNQHLMAEYREMLRVATYAKKRHAKGMPPPPPGEFTLGRGHVEFFMGKGAFMRRRFHEIRDTLLDRNYALAIHDYPEHPPGWQADHQPTVRERALLEARIKERMPAAPRWGKADKPGVKPRKIPRKWPRQPVK